MKVLLTNNTLDVFAGSEIFTYTLAVELKRLGNEVVCFSLQLGKIAKKLIEEGIAVTSDLTSVDDVDIIHAHHRCETLLSFARFLERPMILTCHGVLPWQEQPFKSRFNIYKYVAVSEEVKDHLIQTCMIDSGDILIIRNGVDLNRFYCKKPINPEPKRLLILSNHFPDQQLSIVEEACRRKGISVEKVGLPQGNNWDIEDYINRADVVMTLGRGVLESILCKRVVIVNDYIGADGMVMPENFFLLRQRNFSGRTWKIQYTVDSLVDEIEKYDPDIVDRLFDFVVKEHDISIIANQYMDLYNEAVLWYRENRGIFRNNVVSLYGGINEVLSDFKAQLGIIDRRQREIELIQVSNRRLEIKLQEKEQAETELRLMLQQEQAERQKESEQLQASIKGLQVELQGKEQAETELRLMLQQEQAERQKESEQLQASIKGLQVELQGKEQQIMSLYESLSWRITSPLRKIHEKITGFLSFILSHCCPK